MAIAWLTILKNVPWSDVIRNAPMVADGARKLWKTVARKSSPTDNTDLSEQPAVSPESQTIAVLEARANALEAEMSDLHGQMLAASELIKALADQNTQLIQRIESNRIRTLWLSSATTVIALAVIFGLYHVLIEHGT